MTPTYAFTRKTFSHTFRLEVDAYFLNNDSKMTTPPFMLDGFNDYKLWMEYESERYYDGDCGITFKLHHTRLYETIYTYDAFLKHLSFTCIPQNADGRSVSVWPDTLFYRSKFEQNNCISNGKVVFDITVCFAPPHCINNDVSSCDIQCQPHQIMQRDEATWDLKIEVKNGSFLTSYFKNGTVMVHKAFLSLISPVFNAMFTHNTKEAKTGVITITDFDFATVKAAIDLFYGHRFKPASIHDVIGVLRFAEKYIVEGVVDRLETWLVKNITTDNFNDIAQYAWQHSSEKLKHICAQYYHQHSIHDFRQVDRAILAEIVLL